MKPVEDFLSMVESFPTAFAETIGNGWTTDDVHNAIVEIRQMLSGKHSAPWEEHTNPVYGALNPNELTPKKKYRIHMSQVGTGRLYAIVEVEADNEEEAREEVYEQAIDWKVAKFSGEGYDIDEVEEI